MRETITQKIWLPYPPSLNNLFAHGPVQARNGKTVVRRFVSKPYRKWRKEAETLIKLARLKPVVGPEAEVVISIKPPDRRKRDRDNYRKAILDALTRCGVWPDDDIVDSAPVEWDHERKAVGAIVTIRAEVDVTATTTAKPRQRQNYMSDEHLIDLVRAIGSIPLDGKGRPVLTGPFVNRGPQIARLRDSGRLRDAGDSLLDGRSQTLVAA